MTTRTIPAEANLPKGEEKEVITLDLKDHIITMTDVERAFCFGYLTNPDNNCLDNKEMMSRWEYFKTTYLQHVL